MITLKTQRFAKSIQNNALPEKPTKPTDRCCFWFVWCAEMETTSFLRNRYWVLRHGRSVPNERGLIVSSMVRLFHLLVFLMWFHNPTWIWLQNPFYQENGKLSQYELASEGVNQAHSAGILFQKVWVFIFFSELGFGFLLIIFGGTEKIFMNFHFFWTGFWFLLIIFVGIEKNGVAIVLNRLQFGPFCWFYGAKQGKWLFFVGRL